MARGSRHARKLARTFQLRDWSVGLSGARQCVAQNGVTRAAGSGLRRGQCHGLLTVGWSYSYKELDMRAKPSVALYSTCPPYRGGSGETYLQHVRDVARWSEAGGCEGILVYTDNSLFDPWLVSQVVVEATRTLTPLVAVQPVYMHPYTVAKMMATLSHLYGRRIDLNMVAGGFKNDLLALNDETPDGARALPGGPARSGHPPAGDEGVGLLLAQAAIGRVRPSRRRGHVLDGAVPELQNVLSISRRQLRPRRRGAWALSRDRLLLHHS